jgi:dipeptidyl aminopeptidase/acylaminoacyl peptidase
MVDPERVGIIGFSRTCYHVLTALTTSTLGYRAASITDGINGGYFQYIMDADLSTLNELDAIIGVPPFGKGLETWLQRSPDFNMDKVTTPLQIVALGKWGVLSSWEPYAALRCLHKAVDLIVFTEGQHVMTNPSERVISQGGTVDWFDFWLKDEEDPDPAKAEQYKRWRELRKMQEENERKPYQ